MQTHSRSMGRYQTQMDTVTYPSQTHTYSITCCAQSTRTSHKYANVSVLVTSPAAWALPGTLCPIPSVRHRHKVSDSEYLVPVGSGCISHGWDRVPCGVRARIFIIEPPCLKQITTFIFRASFSRGSREFLPDSGKSGVLWGRGVVVGKAE